MSERAVFPDLEVREIVFLEWWNETRAWPSNHERSMTFLCPED
jgi:hypothetical protein